MSIVVDCRECEASYKLPDRYAGKRCRCKGCKAKIEVPAAAEPKRKKKRAAEVAVLTEAKPERKPKRKSKKPKARATRRLGSQEREIRAEGQAMRDKLAGGRRRPRPVSSSPVSESIHQLAPLNSGALDPVGLRPRREQRQAKRGEAGEAKTKRGSAKADKPRAKKGAGKKGLAQKTTAKLGRGRGEAPAQERGKRATAKLGKGKGTRTFGKRGAKGTTRYGRGRVVSGVESEEGEELELKARPNATRYALFAVLALVGLLCLGVGLAVGGAFGEGSVAASGADKKLEFIEAMAWKGQWEAAQKEAQTLATSLEAEGDAATLAKLSPLKLGIDNMVTIRSIEDDEGKLDQLLRFLQDKEGAVRLGVANELRPLAFQEEGLQGLLALTKDSDPRVAAAASQGMVYAGGLLAIPFLAETIEATAQTGGKLGDIALEKALEINEPEVVPLLVKILETRAKAPASVLRRALSNLTDLAEPEVASKAAQPFLEHADESVREAAQAATGA